MAGRKVCNAARREESDVISFSILALLYLVAIVWVWLRVIMRRPPAGVALAWMVLVVVLPLVGAVLYVLIGERRVGQRRARRIAAIRDDHAKLSSRVIGEGLTAVAWEKHRPGARGWTGWQPA